MRYPNLPLLIVGAGVCFALGRISVEPSMNSEPASSSDKLSTKQSSASSSIPGSNEAVSCGVSAGALAAPAASVAETDKVLRGVPYAVLKGVYLARQDEEWKRVEERYTSPTDVKTETEVKEYANTLFRSFQSNRPEDAYYQARGEWSLRGGKRLPYVAFVSFYSSRPNPEPEDPRFVNSTSGDATLATEGDELCWGTSVYFRVDDKYANESHSRCLGWTATRNKQPYAVHSPYTKRLAPYFDSLSLPLPGFAGDSAAGPEWYDSVRGKWNSLSGLRWEAVTKADFLRLEKDLQQETAID